MEEAETDDETEQDRDEEQEARPRRRGSAKRNAAAAEADENVRPRRRKRPPARQQDNRTALLLAVGAGAILLLVVGVSIGLFLWKRTPAPLAAPPSTTAADDTLAWQTFSPPGRGCSLSMPGTPKPDPQDADSYQLSLPDRSFSIGFRELPEGNNPPFEQLIPRGRKSVMGAYQGSSLVREQAATLAGQPAWEMELQLARGSHLCVRFTVIGRRSYVLTASAVQFNLSAPDVQKFFNSFKISGD